MFSILQLAVGRRSTGWTILGLIAATLAPCSSAMAQQTFPSRLIRLIVPAPPAGAGDMAARAIAKHMEGTLRQPIVVENRPGGGTTIGVNALAKAQPDGYTIGLVSIAGIAIGSTTYPNLPDLRKDLVTIAGIVNAPHVLAIPASLPVKNVAELVTYFKKDPGKHNFASQGDSSLSHLETELFKTYAGVDILHIPYTGSSLALPGLITGTTSMMFDSAASILPHVKSGKLRVLATAASYRVPQFPDAPTMAEAGMPRLRADNPFGFYAPAGTPASAVKVLTDAVEAALASPQTVQTLQSVGLDPHFTEPAEFQKNVAVELELWPSVVRTISSREK